GQHVQHMQAALDQMNIKLHHVIDDLTGLTGQNIVQAILSGQRDPVQLAKLRDRRIQAAESTIAKALEGDWRNEHLFVLQKAWQSWTREQHQTQDCDKALEHKSSQLEPYPEVIKPVKVAHLKPDEVGAQPLNKRPVQKRKVRKKASKNLPDGPWQAEVERFFG